MTETTAQKTPARSCPRCGEADPARFAADRSTRTGRQSLCRACAAKAQAHWRASGRAAMEKQIASLQAQLARTPAEHRADRVRLRDRIAECQTRLEMLS